MKKALLILILVSGSVFAKEKPLDVNELRERLDVIGEIYVLDASGKRLIKKGAEWRSWQSRDEKGKIESNWSSVVDNYMPVAIKHSWEVLADGTIKAIIEQYAQVDDQSNFSKPLRREEIAVENFAPVNWLAMADKEKRIVVRFTPNLREEPATKAIAEVPISGKNIVIHDNLGHLWAENVGVQARYAGFITHRGGLFLSYYPFKGAKPLGEAMGKRMELDLGDKHFVTLRSEEAFLPEGIRAQVYGIVDTSRRTRRLRSIRTIGSSEEAKFQKSMAEKFSEAP